MTANQQVCEQDTINSYEDSIPSVVMTEDVKRKRRVETLSNVFALSAVLDSVITFPLVVYILKKGDFTELAAIASCIHITCFVFLSLISACILLHTKHRYRERIDAIGAWLIIHILNMCGNICIIAFQLYPNVSNLWATSIPLTALIAWKGVFIIIELIGLPYSFYIIHKTVWYINPKNITQHPLFNENERENTSESQNARINQHHPVYDGDNRGQISVIPSGNERIRVPQINHQNIEGDSHRRYDSYMSLSSSNGGLSNDGKLSNNGRHSNGKHSNGKHSNNGRHYNNGRAGNNSRQRIDMEMPQYRTETQSRRLNAYNERFPKVLPNVPRWNPIIDSYTGDNMGYSNDGETSGIGQPRVTEF